MNSSPISSSASASVSTRVLEALMHPQKGLEMRGWLKNHHEKACAWRGENGETMLHWAVLSDPVFASDLVQLGLSYGDLDHLGRTPFDWLTDRVWGAVVNPNTNNVLSAGGKERLLRQSETNAMQIWGFGARPSDWAVSARVWLQAGGFEVLPLFMDQYGVEDYLADGGTLLHACVLAPATPKRLRLLKEVLSGFDVDINTPDDFGRTPLWYASETWLKDISRRSSQIALAADLISLGAKIIPDIHHLSPIDVVKFDMDNEDIMKVLLTASF